MKALMELNREDIRDIIAMHFDVSAENVHVSARATVRVSGEMPIKRPELPQTGKDDAEQMASETEEPDNSSNYAVPDAEKSEPEQTKPQKQMSRVERMFGNRGNWSTAGQEMKPTKGFALIKCGTCGKIRQTFLRDYQAVYVCQDCNTEIPISDDFMKPMHTKCYACNNELKFKTNLTAPQVTMNCKKCGAPIDCKLNGRGTAYITIK